MDCDFSSGEQSEETFQPDKSVMTSSTRTEDIQNASTSGGIPGTASSLPRPTGKPSGGGNETIRRSENISYQTSKVVRHVNLPQGVVRKVSASLLLDHTVSFEKQNGKLKRILTPPSIEKIKSIRDVVAGAIGFDERRGDQLIVESLPFESTQSIEPGPETADPTTRPPGAANGQPNPLWQKPYLWGGVAAVVTTLALAAGWLVRKRRKRSARKASSAPLPPGTVAQALAGPAHNMDLPDAQNAKQLNSQEKPAGYLTEPSNDLQELEELTRKIRQGATSNPEPYVNVVKNWLTEEAR